MISSLSSSWLCLPTRISRVYLYKIAHVFVWCNIHWKERCSPTNYWFIFFQNLKLRKLSESYHSWYLIVVDPFKSPLFFRLLFPPSELPPWSLLPSFLPPFLITSLFHFLDIFLPFFCRDKNSNMFIMHFCSCSFKMYIDYICKQFLNLHK